MANQKYPPRGDSEILEAASQFLNNSATATAAGLTAAEIARLTNERDAGQTAIDDLQMAQTAAFAARALKNVRLETISKTLSEFNRRLQPHPALTDEGREKLGIPIYDTTPTGTRKPTDLPAVRIDVSMPLAHKIYFSEEDRKGKPEGVKAAEIYIKIGGDATGDINDYRFVAQDSESPYSKDFAAEDTGKQAHYMICWVSTNGERGAFQAVSATITSLASNSREL